MDFLKNTQELWDTRAKSDYVWSKPVSSEVIERAKQGDWKIGLIVGDPAPRDWFPESLVGKKVLCLASGGGQQGPVLAAAGADVTVFDYSEGQLEQDRLVAERDGLKLATIQGDMRDLSVFDDESFDLIVHPWSNCYVDNVLPVWRESFRVLKKGGALLAGFANPAEYIFDLKAMSEGKLVPRHKLPYSDLTSISKEELQEFVFDQGEGICFGHTLDDQIGGQIAAGFVIAGFFEGKGGTPLDQFMSGSIATKAIKL